MTDKKITSELREYISRCKADGAGCGALDRIADRIDEAHAESTLAEHNKAVKNATKQLIAEKTDEWLGEHGLVRLPVDADGKPWHFEDTVTASNGVWQVVGIASYPGARQDLVKNLVMQNRWTGDILRCNALELTRDDPTPAGRIRAAVRALTGEGGADGPALKDLLDIADELEGDGND